MKVVEVVPGILESASGPSQSLPGLCSALNEQGVSIELHVADGIDPSLGRYRFTAYKKWMFPPRADVSPQAKRGIALAACKADLIHSHGLWNMLNLYAGRGALRANRPHILSPRGTLSPEALKLFKWKKEISWYLGQGRYLHKADVLHATCEKEYQDIRSYGIKAPVAIIPNGVSEPTYPRNGRAHSSRRRLLYLSRFTRIKGIEFLLQAWKEVQDQFIDWDLHLAGPDDRGWRSEMERLSKALGLKRFFFGGPIYGCQRTETFYQADLFVLPSRSENFGMAVADALSHGVPVIASKGTPWQKLEAKSCGWWIPVGVQPLVETLMTAMSLSPEQLGMMGQNGQAWISKEFSWTEIGTKMKRTYEWLLYGGETPSWVRLE